MTATWNDVAPELIDAMLRLFPSGLTWRRTFPGRPDQIPQARHFVRFLLTDAPCRDDAEQIVAELAGNAVSHTASGDPHGTFIVEVLRRPATIRITVYDHGRGGTPRFDRGGHAGPLDEHGRGLALVAALASEVGCRGTRAVGHAVWAQFSTADVE
ncbi:ATP-binding protein [Streptosporangium roseum]|uniref:ATP-binding protein n=1 Tax=Streptosporangium roseum TaxID=2001 RepID=UPI00331B8384